MAKELKTNAARLLSQAKIEYRLVSYPVDEAHLDAVHVAESIGEDPDRVFKTLVLRGSRCGLIVCVIPAPCELDLKKVARVVGDKKVEMLAVRDLLGSTGYIRGGCSPIGMKKALPTYIDSTASLHSTIYVSAGVRGMQLEVAPADLIAFTRATTADLTI